MVKAFYTKVIKFGNDKKLQVPDSRVNQNRLMASLLRTSYLELLSEHNGKTEAEKVASEDEFKKAS